MVNSLRNTLFSVNTCLLVAALAISGGCHSDRVLLQDSLPPVLLIFTPHDSTYDQDADGLVDVQVSWSDPAGITLTSVELRSLEGVNGPAGSTNLLSAWRVERLDSSGLVLHETVQNLLPAGPNRLQLTVTDTAGNTLIDTLTFVLPYGALHKTLESGVTSAGHGVGAVVCADDRRAYVTIGRHVVIIDADSLQVIGSVRNNSAADDLSTPLCVPGDPILYVTERVERFDRLTMQWLPRIAGSFESEGIAQSRATPTRLYVGESTVGGIAIVDRTTGTRTGFTPIPWTGAPESPEYVFDIAVLNGDAKLYFTRYVEGGIFVANPLTGTVIKHIGIGGPTWPDSGRSDAFVLSNDQLHLYVSVLDGDPRGVVDISTATDATVRRLPLPDYVPQEIAQSPSGNRLFVTTQDRLAGTPSENVLIDVNSWTVIANFQRPRAPGATRFDGGVAFHPNGKLVFVGRDKSIDVYLNRE